MCHGSCVEVRKHCRNLFSSHCVSPRDKTDYQAWQQVPLLGDQTQGFLWVEVVLRQGHTQPRLASS